MSGFEEVARVTAVVGADLSALDAAYAGGEKSTAKFAATTKASLDAAEKSAERSTRSMAKALERAAVAHSAAGVAAERAIAKVTAAHASGASAVEKSSTSVNAAMRSQVSSAAMAGAAMSKVATDYTKMASSAERAAAMQQEALGRAAAGAKAHAAATAQASKQASVAMEKQATVAKASAATTRTAVATSGTALDGAGRRASVFGRQVASGLGLVGGYGAVAAVAGILKTGATFDAQMSRVRAVTASTQAEFDAMRGAAIRLGAESVFSATEAAQGMEILGAAGMSSSQVIQAMPGLLDGAAASGEGFAGTASILTASLGAFRLEASASGHVMDVLAAAAMASDASIGDIGESLKYAAPVAKSFKMGIEQTAAVLTLFAQAGIKGSQGGTVLRASLAQLADGRGASAKEVKRLGIEIETAGGKMRPFSHIVADLGKKYAGMSDGERLASASAMFGTEAMAGMLKVIEDSQKPIDDLTRGFQNADGAADKMASTMTDNLAGDLEQLKGALESAAIKVSDAFRPQLRRQVARFEVYVNSEAFERDAKAVVGTVLAVGQAFAESAAFVYQHKDAIMALGVAYLGLRAASAGAAMLGGLGAAGAVGRGAGMAGAATSAAGAAVAAGPKLMTFARIAGTAARALTGLGIATIGAQALWALAHSGSDAAGSAEAAAERIATLRGEIAQIKSKHVVVEIETKKTGGKGGPASKPTPTLAPGDMDVDTNDTVRGMVAAAEAAEKRLEGATNRRSEAQQRASAKEAAVAGMRLRYAREYQAALDAGMSKTDAVNSPPVKAAEKGLNAARDAAKDARVEFKNANDELAKSKGVADSAKRGMEELTQKIAGISKVKTRGSIAKQLVKDMSDTQMVAAFGTLKVNAALKQLGYVQVNGSWFRSYKEYDKMVASAAAAAPGKINAFLAMIGATDPSSRAAQKFMADVAAMRAAANRPIVVSVAYRVGARPDPAKPVSGQTYGAKAGGKITGPGSGTSDSIAAWLSNGEHVITAEEVRAAGGHGAVEAWRAGVKAGMPAYAKGGKVTAEQRKAASDRKDKRHEKSTGRWGNLVDGQSLLESRVDKQLALAERTGPGSKKGGKSGFMDDIAALLSLAKQQDAARTAYNAFRSGSGAANRVKVSKSRSVSMFSLLAPGEKAGVEQAINGALRGAADARKRAAELGGPKPGSPEKGATDLEAMQEKYGLRFAELDAQLAAAEGTADFGDDKSILEQIAAAYGDQRGDLEGLIPKLAGRDRESANSALAGAIRGKADALKKAKEGGEGVVTDDMRAQLDQALQARDIEKERARLSEAAVATFSGSSDIGYGGGANAYQAAGGAQPPVVYNINSLSGNDVAIQRAMANASNSGNAAGSNGAKFYSGRR